MRRTRKRHRQDAWPVSTSPRSTTAILAWRRLNFDAGTWCDCSGMSALDAFIANHCTDTSDSHLVLTGAAVSSTRDLTRWRPRNIIGFARHAYVSLSIDRLVRLWRGRMARRRCTALARGLRWPRRSCGRVRRSRPVGALVGVVCRTVFVKRVSNIMLITIHAGREGYHRHTARRISRSRSMFVGVIARDNRGCQ